MTVIYVLIPIAILLTIIGLYVFFWAVKSEQFNDLEKEGMSILYDEDKKQKPQEKELEDSAPLNKENNDA